MAKLDRVMLIVRSMTTEERDELDAALLRSKTDEERQRLFYLQECEYCTDCGEELPDEGAPPHDCPFEPVCGFVLGEGKTCGHPAEEHDEGGEHPCTVEGCGCTGFEAEEGDEEEPEAR